MKYISVIYWRRFLSLILFRLLGFVIVFSISNISYAQNTDPSLKLISSNVSESWQSAVKGNFYALEEDGSLNLYHVSGASGPRLISSNVSESWHSAVKGNFYALEEERSLNLYHVSAAFGPRLISSNVSESWQSAIKGKFYAIEVDGKLNLYFAS